LDEEYEPNDNNPPINTKTPVEWMMQADPTSGLPCFVNRSTGAKVKINLYIRIFIKLMNHKLK